MPFVIQQITYVLYELLLNSLYLIQKISFLVLLRQFSRQNAKGSERECACGGRAKVPLPSPHLLVVLQETMAHSQ